MEIGLLKYRPLGVKGGLDAGKVVLLIRPVPRLG